VPIYHFHCEACQAPTRRLLAVADQRKPGVCPKCGGTLIRDYKAPSMIVVERLDNGAMGKALERFADAEEVFRERKDKSIREAKIARGEEVPE
jgi:putative FmdB family regulatory protein